MGFFLQSLTGVSKTDWAKQTSKELARRVFNYQRFSLAVHPDKRQPILKGLLNPPGAILDTLGQPHLAWPDISTDVVRPEARFYFAWAQCGDVTGKAVAAELRGVESAVYEAAKQDVEDALNVAEALERVEATLLRPENTDVPLLSVLRGIADAGHARAAVLLTYVVYATQAFNAAANMQAYIEGKNGAALDRYPDSPSDRMQQGARRRPGPAPSRRSAAAGPSRAPVFTPIPRTLPPRIDAVRDDEGRAKLTVRLACTACDGLGMEITRPGTTLVACSCRTDLAAHGDVAFVEEEIPLVRGPGRVVILHTTQARECATCRGSGVFRESVPACRQCEGSGYAPARDLILVVPGAAGSASNAEDPEETFGTEPVPVPVVGRETLDLRADASGAQAVYLVRVKGAGSFDKRLRTRRDVCIRVAPLPKCPVFE